MKSKILFLSCCIALTTATMSGQIENTEISTAKHPSFKADLDHEFDNGSSIKFPKLNAESINNLSILGKIWGFLKYYHPAVGEGLYNWDYELFRFLPEYLVSNEIGYRNKLLLEWINKLGTITACNDCKQTDSNAFLKPDLAWIQESQLTDSLKNQLHFIYKNRHQGTHYYVTTDANIPLPVFDHENDYAKMPYPDKAFRLLSLYRFWNMVHYYFPYKHLIDTDWNEILKTYIPLFLDTRNELDYELAALLLIGEVQDTHANLYGGKNKINEWRGNYYAPVNVGFIEEKLVVTDYFNPEFKDVVGLEKGDVITEINGKKVSDIVDSIAKYYPASNEPTRLRNISADLLRSAKNSIEIKYIQDSIEITTKLDLYEKDSLNIYRWYTNDTKKSYKLLDGNIGYITLKSITNEDFDHIKNDFKETKGIIIDIRNYPATFVPFALGSFFLAKAKPFVKFTTANTNNPGEFTFTQAMEIPPSKEYYDRKVVVILNELSQSQAEYSAMAFRAGDNTTIIGSTTAGADGNSSKIVLPGGLRTMFTGIGVYYPDGTETQRVGIIPDLMVTPTIKGIKEGRDELLEKAIELIDLD